MDDRLMLEAINQHRTGSTFVVEGHQDDTYSLVLTVDKENALLIPIAENISRTRLHMLIFELYLCRTR